MSPQLQALQSFLRLAVPLEMARLSALSSDDLVARAQRHAATIGAHGDGLLYPTARSAQAASALAEGLALPRADRQRRRHSLRTALVQRSLRMPIGGAIGDITVSRGNARTAFVGPITTTG